VFIFAAPFVVLIFLLALVFDGAGGIVRPPRVPHAADAAALAAANVVQGTPAQGITKKGCSAIAGPPTGAPQAWVIAAAKASVALNLPGYDLSKVVVTCPSGYLNWAVQVSLGQQSPTFFGSIFGTGPLNVKTLSVALNGQDATNQYSVVLLDPSATNPVDLGWNQQYNGCPSFLLNGGPTVKFDSSIYINSACDAAHGGALQTKGNSATLTLGVDSQGNPVQIRIVGDYVPQALQPPLYPLTGQNPRPDPLLFLVPPPLYPANPAVGLKVQSTHQLVVGQGNSSATVALDPGIYKGGIILRNQSKVYLHPGIYVMDGGGLNLGAGQSLYTVDQSVGAGVTVNDANWSSKCTTGNCGVMIYNTGSGSYTSPDGTTHQCDGTYATMGAVTFGAQAHIKFQSYNPDADTTLLSNGNHYVPDPTFRNLMVWQSKCKVPSKTYQQPIVSLSGGGSVFMSGTIYAPSGAVAMGGTSGGSGGDTIDLTLQFVVWDLQLSGNSNFYFRYSAEQTTTPLSYGLIK
jgi:Flp pilus assembly protein TadG